MKKAKHTRQALLTAALSTLSTLSTAFAGTTCTDGVMRARPVKDGRPPVIDGKFDDWDLSGVVRCWNAEAYAEQQNCSLALMYDDDALYLAVEMTFAGRNAQNPNRPQDRYWWGDLVQFRLCTDPKLGYPLPHSNRNDKKSVYRGNPSVTCVNVWKNTTDGSDNLYFTPGFFFDCATALNPAGTAVRIVTPDGKLRAEAKMPWKTLGVASGRNPFKAGEKMPAVFDIKWSPGTDGHFTAAVFRKDPGPFAFLNAGYWGQVAFTAADEKAPKVASYAEIAAAARAGSAGPRDGARIAFTLPKKAKVSVNILDEKGGVVRELAGGELHDAGEVAFYWDGRDARGFACETGKAYRWAAYAHDGLDVEYFGTVGTSGNPPYDTPDGKGGWGGDHGPVVAAAADDTGRYFVWHGSESGKAIVKTDFAGQVIWRATPFVSGGFGAFTAAVAKDGVLALVVGEKGKDAKLIRVDAATGNYLLFPDNTGAADIGLSKNAVTVPEGCAVRPEFFFDCAGLAAIGDELFAGDYAGGCIRVVEAKTGKARRTLPCAGVRGLAATADGKLLAACLQPGRVVKIDPKTGAAETVLEEKDGLVAPYGVAIDAAGAIYVSDLGTSQQVKKFEGRRLVYAVGKAGGRGALGRIDFDALRFPFGVAVDRTGALLVTEAAPPKIVRVLDAATGRETRRYFGYTAYSPTNVPDCDDPLLQYYSLSGPDCFARARIPAAGGIGEPDACWDFEGAGYDEIGCVYNTMSLPEVVRMSNGVKYLVTDSPPDHRKAGRPMIVCKIEGDAITPVAGVFSDEKSSRAFFRVWSDENGDGRVQESECSAKITSVEGRKVFLGDGTGIMYIDAEGNLYVSMMSNFVVCLPSRGFSPCGAPRWDASKARVALPEILPGLKILWSGHRTGHLGTRRDSSGNFYTAVNGSPEYATPEYTKYMHQGMGHTADMGGVFILKYDPQGQVVWCVGRKAVGGIKDGELLHHWSLAGMIGDDYLVVGSEWGVFTVYTTDGFYVDRFFDAPGLPGRGIPYAFGGEDFSGMFRYFPARDEAWAYNAGHTFRVTGIEKGRVKGEWRTSGTVALDKVLPLVFPGAKERALTDVKLARKDGKVVYTAHVADATPLVNVARGAADVFKGGDAVGFQMGPATAPKELPERKPSGRKVGFARVLAARVGGADRVFAFKPFVAAGERKPVEYATPAGGTSAFEFVGEVPGAKVAFTPDADGKGYAVRIEVPEAFFELDFAKDVFFDAEALFSGDGGRGLQTVRREWLHTPDSSEATMVDDVPTEARLRPKGWQRVAW